MDYDLKVLARQIQSRFSAGDEKGSAPLPVLFPSLLRS